MGAAHDDDDDGVLVVTAEGATILMADDIWALAPLKLKRRSSRVGRKP